MRVFMTVLKLNLKVMIQYRSTYLATLVGEPILYLINVVIYSALFAFNDKSTMAGYDLAQLIWYFGGISLIWQCIYNSADSNVSRKILSGDLAVDLLKPASLFKLELAYALSNRIIGVCLEFMPCLFIYGLFFYPRFMTMNSLLKFMAVIGMAFVLYLLINYLIGLAAFFIKSNYSLQNIKFILINLTAGGFLPLDFFPEWFRKIAALLPFQYLFYWPIQVFLNREASRGQGAFLRILGFQLGWILVLYLCSKALWKQAIKKFCAVGG
jgi:ABC-2 type transport system permease protein